MKDYLVRGMSMDGFVKVVAVRSTEMVRRGAEIQGTTPNATAAFGRALTVSSMMHGEYGIEDVVLSMPCILGKDGIETKVPISLSEEEIKELQESAKVLKEITKELNL